MDVTKIVEEIEDYYIHHPNKRRGASTNDKTNGYMNGDKRKEQQMELPTVSSNDEDQMVTPSYYDELFQVPNSSCDDSSSINNNINDRNHQGMNQNASCENKVGYDDHDGNNIWYVWEKEQYEHTRAILTIGIGSVGVVITFFGIGFIIGQF